MKRLSEFGQKKWTAQQVDMSELLGKDVTILDVHWLEGEKGIYASILVSVDGQDRFVNTGAKVVVKLLKAAQEDNSLPVAVKFVERLSQNKRKYIDVE